jgi:hypothetical protein
MRPVDVYLEAGQRRTFACALDWPGWCRSGKGEDDALEALAAYAPRYAAVVAEAGLTFPKGAGQALDVIERLPGSAATDYGALDQAATRDHDPTTRAQSERIAALVAASWQVLDGVVATAPATLRKGPRGGGRDRDAVAEHVLAAEHAYARKLGLRLPATALGDQTAIDANRDAILAVLRRPSDGTPVVEKGWPLRYAARRIAWHALDHAWEIEDKSEPG